MLKGYFTKIIIVYSIAAYGQNDSYKAWMVHEILKDTAFKGNIFSYTISGTERFYWPEDFVMVSQDNYIDGDHLFKTKEGLHTALEGTGRIYRIEEDTKSKTGLRFIRLDSTIFIGYNIGASVFYNHDTLYSLGGYGLWNFNWHLRYFRPTRRGWEVFPLNRPISHINHPGYNYLDEKERIFYLVREEFFNEGLKSSNKKMKEFGSLSDTLFLEKLNLDSKDWEKIGVFNPEVGKILTTTYFIGRTPWGNLMSASDRYDNKCYLVNFRQNRIFELRDKRFASKIRDASQSGQVSSVPAWRTLSYFSNDSLHFLNSNKEKFVFKLSIKDFKETPTLIWTPLSKKFFSFEEFGSEALLGLGCATFLAGIWFFYRAGKKQNGSNGNLFNKQELEALQRFAASPEMIIKPDDLDQVLGTEGRTMEALKKRRSMLIRSINTKYSDHFDDEDDLIRTERLEVDRRMVQYVVDVKHHSKIQKILKT